MINLELKQIADKKNPGCLLLIGGEMTIAHGAELKQALQELLAGSGALTIDCAEVERVDLCGLQLLCAIVRSAAEQGAQLVINLQKLPVFQQAMRSAGIPANFYESLSGQSKEAF